MSLIFTSFFFFFFNDTATTEIYTLSLHDALPIWGPHMSLPPFPSNYRASGVLLHVTSLPSPYGIGDVGPTALAWIDRLHEAGQSWWQALPVGPIGVGDGDSPYQPLSSFAGNGLRMSPD